VYSIPVYALRFAAHCRARLRYSELTAAENSRGATLAGAPRFWIRFAPHPARVGLAGRCAERHLTAARS